MMKSICQCVFIFFFFSISLAQNNGSYDETSSNIPNNNSHNNSTYDDTSSNIPNNSSHSNTTNDNTSSSIPNNSSQNNTTYADTSSNIPNNSIQNNTTFDDTSSNIPNNSSQGHEISSDIPPGDYKGCFSKVFAFGDSYTDTGNAHFLGGQNDHDFSNSAATSTNDSSKTDGNSANSDGNSTNPDGNSTNRFSNGRLVIDFLSEALHLPPVPAYKEPSANFKNGVNFAIAGSTFFSRDHFSWKNISRLMWKGIPANFQLQMDWFNKYMADAGCNGQGSCKSNMDDSLLWIGPTGVADYTRAQGSSFSLPRLSEMSVTNVGKLLMTLLEKGGKYAVVQGLPPIGCLPIDMSSGSTQDRDHMGCAGLANKAIMIHNQLLQRKLEMIRKAFPHCKILYADYWNAYLTILKNLKTYHMDEPFKACCGSPGGKFNFNKDALCGSPGTSVCKDPSRYISWDGIHLTEAMHKHLADLFLNQGFCSPPFSELIKMKRSI